MNNVDLFVLSHGPDSLTYTPYLHADWSELKPALSPDERWVAYVSAETGSSEVWVRPFADAAAGRWRVSSGGGEDPIWSPDGGTLYWWEGPELRAARVNTARGFELTDRRTVLADPQYAVQCCFANYDVMPDGSIIMARHVAPPTTPGFIMITNWFAEMQSRIRSATADAPQP
jgi:hypothetical protein